MTRVCAELGTQNTYPSINHATQYVFYATKNIETPIIKENKQIDSIVVSDDDIMELLKKIDEAKDE